jgi:hypothetical protein
MSRHQRGHLEDDQDSAERFDRHAQALAAGVGALAALPFGPFGSVVGAALGPLLVPVAGEIFRELGMDGRRRSGEALAATCEASGLSTEETVSRALSNEKSRLLSATAIVAAIHTTWEDKVRTLGRSLASGLLAADDAEVDSEQLIMSAIADLEGPHLALLDLLVSWHPPQSFGDIGPERVDISAESSADEWGVRQRRWTTDEIATYRPRLTPVLSGLLGTLQRHGLALFESNAEASLQRLGGVLREEQQRQDALKQSGRPTATTIRRSIPGPLPPVWTPTRLGELVWLRFHDAGANAPDVWTQPLAHPQAGESGPTTDGA